MRFSVVCLSLIFFSSGLLANERFILAEGLQAIEAVSEGLVEFPMMATLDDRGRLFVAESRGNNLSKEEYLAQKPGFIRLLEDTDKDGVFDRSQVFAEDLTFPQGALWIYDSLYVMSPPSLWRLLDADGDGFCERREELATGFDFTGNAADVHGPFLHPNGRIFWSHGRKNFAIPDPDTNEILFRGKGARIWSATLSGGEIEPFAGGGMDNPVEIDFTDRGEIVGTVNLFYSSPRGDTLTHWVHGGAYPRHDQAPALQGLDRTGPLLQEIHNFGHVAVSGMCRYRSGSLNSSWRNHWLVAHFNTARITRTKTVRSGATFSAGETEIIFEINDPDAHLSDVLEDGNGDLLAVNTGGWFRSGCPTSHSSKQDKKGTIYRISKKEIPYQPVPLPDWKRLTAAQVSDYLDSEPFTLRDRAILELAERGDPSIPELRRLLRDPASSVQERRNAIWTLSRMRFSESSDLIYDALVDPAPSVRQAAANAISVTRSWQSIAANQPAERAIELERNRTISGALARIVRSDESSVAQEAAVALGSMAETRATGAIFGRLGRTENDSFLRHSLIHALIQMDDAELARQGLESENPLLVSGVLQALGQMPSASLEVLDVLPYLDSPDKLLRETAVTIAVQRPTWDAALSNRFFSWEEEMSETREFAMNRLMPAFAGALPMHPVVASYLDKGPEAQATALEWLRSSDFGKIAPDWEPALLRILEQGPTSPLFETVLEVLERQSGNALLDALDRWVEEPSLPVVIQVKVLQARNRDSKELSDESFRLLLDLLSKESEPSIRMDSLDLLTKAKLSESRKSALATHSPSASYSELIRIMSAFRTIDSMEQAEPLSIAISESTGFHRFDPDRLRQLFRPIGGAPFDRIRERIARDETEKENRAEKLDQLLALIPNADPSRGKQLFFAGVGNCITCHQIDDEGGQVGPSLSRIGEIRNAKAILESILYPDISIARDYETFEVIENGSGSRSHIGILKREDLDALTLVDAAARSTTIKRSQIRSILSREHSLMPPGLEQLFEKNGLSDLVAYLLQLQEKPGLESAE